VITCWSHSTTSLDTRPVPVVARCLSIAGWHHAVVAVKSHTGTLHSVCLPGRTPPQGESELPSCGPRTGGGPACLRRPHSVVCYSADGTRQCFKNPCSAFVRISAIETGDVDE